MSRTFISRPEYYERDREKAVGISVAAAKLTPNEGEPEAAIALFTGNNVMAVLPVDHAYRIAHELADQLIKIRREVQHD